MQKDHSSDLASIFAESCQKMALAEAKIEPKNINAMRPMMAIIQHLSENGFPTRLTQYERTRDGGYALSLSMDCLKEGDKPVSFEHEIHISSQDSAGKTVLASLDLHEDLSFLGRGSWINITDQDGQREFATKLVELTAFKFNMYKKAQKAQAALCA